MKIHPEDPRLTAFAAGELDAAEAAKVEAAIAQDPALRQEVEAIHATITATKRETGLPATRLLPAQKEEVLRLARETDQSDGSSPAFSGLKALQGWLIPAAAAAVLVVATWLLLRMPGDNPAPVVKNPASGPAPTARTNGSPATPETSASPAMPAPTVYTSPAATTQTPATLARLDLPIRKEAAGLEAVSRPIMDESRLPARETVRPEEILNTFPLRLSGTTSIARNTSGSWHPDQRPAGVPPVAATLSTEMFPCPWKPSAVLLLVSVRGNPNEEVPVSVSFVPDLTRVARYRILGYKNANGVTDPAVPSSLAAGASTLLALEIEPSGPQKQLGSLEWAVQGAKAPAVKLDFNREAEPSDDARFAALVCAFSQWLSGEQAGIIDGEIVSGLARELDSANLAPERAAFLSLVNRSLHL